MMTTATTIVQLHFDTSTGWRTNIYVKRYGRYIVVSFPSFKTDFHYYLCVIHRIQFKHNLFFTVANSSVAKFALHISEALFASFDHNNAGYCRRQFHVHPAVILQIEIIHYYFYSDRNYVYAKKKRRREENGNDESCHYFQLLLLGFVCYLFFIFIKSSLAQNTFSQFKIFECNFRGIILCPVRQRMKFKSSIYLFYISIEFRVWRSVVRCMAVFRERVAIKKDCFR